MRAVVLAPGEGQFIAVRFTGRGVTMQASRGETGGLCTVWEGRVEPGMVGAAAHYHRERDEAFYILQGEAVLRIGEERHAGGAATFAFVPRDTIHGFHNASGDTAALLIVHHPAGVERYLEEFTALLPGTEPGPLSRVVSLVRPSPDLWL